MMATDRQIQLLMALTRAYPVPITYDVAVTMTSKQISREITKAEHIRDEKLRQMKGGDTT